MFNGISMTFNPVLAALMSARIVPSFDPLTLFANGEPGVWYDPSDLSTLFQDAAGTQPVTAVEQPVGLMLDKSKGLVLGSELVSNVADREFTSDTGWWTKSGSAAIGGGICTLTTISSIQRLSLLPIGKWVVIEYDLTVRGGGLYIPGYYSQTNQTTSGHKRFVIYTVSGTLTFIVDAAGGDVDIDNISVRELPGNHAYQSVSSASRPVLSARVNQYLATETLATQNVTTLAAQYRLSFEGTGTITLSGTATGVYSAGSHLITCTAGTLTSTVSGSVTKADLRVANTGAGLPAYQRVNTATDYDTVGFPHYLRFINDDWLVTNTITPGVDKAQVFAGVRKLSDAATALVAETSTTSLTNNGSISLFAPDNPTPSLNAYSFVSRGTTRVFAINGGPPEAPTTNILTGIGDISGDSTILRVNGTQVAQSTADQGTGNYLAYPLYIGRRGGTTLPFNGHLYNLIVRFGANLPTATIENTENYINTKTRAF